MPRHIAARKQPAPPIPHADEISDGTLISAIAEKAVWAMEILYQRYNRLLYALVHRIVGNQQVGEDLMQKHFLRCGSMPIPMFPKMAR